MKYIKKFNESKADKLYKRIRYNDGNIEFGAFFTGKKRNTLDKLLIQMDNRVFSEIEKYKTDYYLDIAQCGWKNGEPDFIKYIKMYNRMPFLAYIENMYEIYEVVDNYYFIIEQTKKRNAYWICDQLEGLIEFLKDKKVIV